MINIVAYEEFLEANAVGKKAAAAAAIRVFISSFSSFDEIEAWVVALLERYESGKKIRHEIFEELVWPVLLKGYRESNARSIKWLAATVDNLHRAKRLWAQIDFITDYELLKMWNKLEPECKQAKVALLERIIAIFRDSEHEWPAGILYGNGGANLEECNEIAGEIVEARALDTGGIYTSFLDEYQEKLDIYTQRLSRA